MKSPRAFSLVEVTLAIGIVSFALLAVVGLLPIGLRSVKNAAEEAAAANTLHAIASSLRMAQPVSISGASVVYSNSFAGRPIVFSNSPTEVQWSELTLEGTESAAMKRLSARLAVLEPPSSGRPGRAVISVAWSAITGPVWNPATLSWSGAEGSLTSGLQFLPRE